MKAGIHPDYPKATITCACGGIGLPEVWFMGFPYLDPACHELICVNAPVSGCNRLQFAAIARRVASKARRRRSPSRSEGGRSRPMTSQNI